jgi:hypothetical protein
MAGEGGVVGLLAAILFWWLQMKKGLGYAGPFPISTLIKTSSFRPETEKGP